MFHFYNALLNLFNISSLFSGGTILFPINSPALWTTFLEPVFKESSPVSKNCFLYFLVNDKNPSPLNYFLVLGSIEYRRISIY